MYEKVAQWLKFCAVNHDIMGSNPAETVYFVHVFYIQSSLLSIFLHIFCVLYLLIITTMHIQLKSYINKRAQKALGRSPEEKVKGHSGAIYRGPLMLSTKYW